MKKVFAALFCTFLSFVVYSYEYQITDVKYDITGCGAKIWGKTQDYVLNNEVSVNKKKVFETEEDFLEYIEDYKQRLVNTRAFEEINVDYSVTEPDTQTNICNVTLFVTVKDSFRLFVIPGPKYDSNSGLILKIKLKDSNFLGSLNTLSSDIYFLLPTSESDGNNFELGLNCNFDYPFNAGIFDATWINDLGLSFTIGNERPEFNFTTGLKLSLPFDKTSIVFELDQQIVNDYSYKEFKDSLYFVEGFNISVPFTLVQSKHLGNLVYKPYSKVNVNWDINGINKLNSDLSSPVMTIGHKLSFGRIDWDENLRTGLSATLDNYYTYNFQRNTFYPIIAAETQLHKSFQIFEDFPLFNHIGFSSSLYAFTFMFDPQKDKYIFNDGLKIGSYLRGIRDSQDYAGTNVNSLNTTSAIVFNFDVPLRIIKTNFKHQFLNFDWQMSPFFDAALCYNKITKKYFDLKDGFYGAGLEMIVYPVKWSGITIRASVGIDVGRKFFSNYINTDWRENTSKKELSLGFGLHY